jgi:hypothetical protein
MNMVMSRVEAMNEVKQLSRLYQTNPSWEIRAKAKQKAWSIKQDFEFDLGEFLMLWTESWRTDQHSGIWRRKRAAERKTRSRKLRI